MKNALGCFVFFVIMLGLIIFGLFSYGVSSFVFRYRIQVEIETSQGLRQGSSVLETTLIIDERRWFPQATGSSIKTKGEAIFVDFGNGKSVFALIEFDTYDFRSIQKQAGQVELSRVQVPTIVTFVDISNPASAKVVYGGKRSLENVPGAGWQYILRDPIDEFAATFGPGYAFKRATVEIVPNDTPITRGIEGRLPGLKDIEAWNKLARTRQSPSDPYGGGSGALIRNW